MSRFTAPPRAVRAPASFNFTYSKLDSFENCPKKYSHLYVLKDVQEPESEHLRIGNEVHAALADAISKGIPLPAQYAKYQHHVDRVLKDSADKKLLVEQGLAINRNFGPTEYFGSDVWYRGKCDVIKIDGDIAAIIDWKTGKPQENSVQLALMAALTFAHHPEVQVILTQFCWLKDDFNTDESFERKEMVELWSALLPRVEMMEQSHKTMEFPPVENPLCKWCPVTKCSFNKKG